MEQLRHENGLLNGIIRFSLNNRMVVLVIAALCLVAGIYSTTHTEVDVFPDLNAPTVVVMTEAEGMAPEEVERLVTFPIETAVNGATNVRRVRSSSATGFSIVNIEFDWGTDIYKARQIVSEKIAMIGDDLPENVGKPTLGPQASILGELMIIGLTADTTSMQDLRTIADWTIRPRLLSTGGVAQVAVMGGDIKEYQILMDPGRMRRFGVSMDEVIYAVKGMNQNASGGTLYEYGNEYIVRGLLSTNDLDEMKKAVVKTSENGLPITLDAVADVRIGPKTSLVDDSIVDVENVFKRLRQNREKPEGERESIVKVVYEASKEVRMPMLNSTLIIIASFLPLFFLSGMEGRMLKPLGITFIISLMASTLVALTVTPVLSSFLLGRRGGDKTEREPALVRWLKKVYGKALHWSLDHKKTLLGGVGALLAAAIVMFFTLGGSFLPAFNEGSFTISVSTIPGISLEESDRMGRTAEELLLSIPEIKTVGRKTGRAELDEHAFGVNSSEFECPFELGRKTRKQLTEEVREKLSVLPGVNIEIGGPISHRIDAMLSGTKANIAIKLFGSDLNRMYEIGQKIKTSISGVEGIADINVEQQVERPELNLTPKREMLARYGITLPEFAEVVRVMMEGEVVSTVYEGNRSFDLTLKVGDDARSTIERISDLTIDTGDGRKIPLSYVADIRSAAGPNTINRENVSRKLVVSCNATGGELAKAVGAIREKIAENIELPEGYHIEYGGQFESEERASKTIALVSIFSIFIIFMLLYGEFKNISQSLVVLLNLPLALIGGVFAVFFTDGILSIPAIIGFISLFGIATRNGMLLIDRYNVLSSQGLSREDAVMTGSLDRLNPILMTAITSALALLPLALGGDLPGNEIQSPMAKVILGGLFSSTLLNGFVVPVIYLINSKSKRKVKE